MRRAPIAISYVSLAIMLLGSLWGVSNPVAAETVSLSPAAMPRITSVDVRYQSYNVEMAEVIGGKFWKPYSRLKDLNSSGKSAPASAKPGGGFQIGQGDLFEPRSPVELANSRLRKLAAALGPAYVRVSGTWANSVYFQNTDDPTPGPPPKGFTGTLTRREWSGAINFARAVDAKVVTSFAISEGVRDKSGVWTPREARKLLAYTKSIGGEIAAAELFNEPSIASMGGAPPGYNAATFGRDIKVFRAFTKASSPGMLIVGPGSAGEGIALIPANVPMLTSAALLSASPTAAFDVFSYHYYGAASERCAKPGSGMGGTTQKAALSEEWLSQTDRVFDFYKPLRDKYAPGKPIWITETADAACGGNPWASTFLDSFRYLDQLGRLARLGVKAVFHNTLASSEYGLIDQSTFSPRPNYWSALLWRRLMGTTVLDAGASRPNLHLYAQCLRDRAGGVAILAINTGQAGSLTLNMPLRSERYTLTAQRLDGKTVRLNGTELVPGASGDLPAINGKPQASGSVTLSPASITFLTIAQANNPACR